MGGGYKEDPKDKAARMRERRITDIERQKTAEQQASGLTSDIRAIYGMKGLVSKAGTVVGNKKAAVKPFSGSAEPFGDSKRASDR